jgi:hypothetical protein
VWCRLSNAVARGTGGGNVVAYSVKEDNERGTIVQSASGRESRSGGEEPTRGKHPH